MAGHVPLQLILQHQALPPLQAERIMVIKEDVALVSLKAPHTINDAVNTLRLMQLPDGSFLDARATSDRIMARHAHWEAQVSTASCFLLSWCSWGSHLMHGVNLDAEAAVTCVYGPGSTAAHSWCRAAVTLHPCAVEQSQACCCAGGCTDQKDVGA